jgi:hypothetical protein
MDENTDYQEKCHFTDEILSLHENGKDTDFNPIASDLNTPQLTQHSDLNTHSTDRLHRYVKH